MPLIELQSVARFLSLASMLGGSFNSLDDQDLQFDFSTRRRSLCFGLSSGHLLTIPQDLPALTFSIVEHGF